MVHGPDSRRNRPASARWLPPDGAGPVAVAALLAVHAALLLASIPQQAVSGDEFAHLPAGIAAWRTGSFFIDRENPPLPRLVAAAPVLLSADITLDLGGLEPEPHGRPEWILGDRFMYANSKIYLRSYWVARTMSIGWSILGALTAWAWAGRLHGRRAGIFAVLIWTFEPNILANAQLVTPDMAAASLGLVAGYAFWRYLQEPALRSALLAGLALGLALLTKFTLIMLVPTFALLALLELSQAAREARTLGHVARRCRELCVVGGVGLFVLNLGYGFERSLEPLGSFEFVSEAFTDNRDVEPRESPGGQHAVNRANRFRGTPLAAVPAPLPANYLLGLDSQMSDHEERGFPAYLAGELRRGGWWDYYLIAAGLKLPLGLLGLTLLAAVAAGPRHALATPSLVIPATLMFALISSRTGINSHFRYILPCLPFLVVLLGRCASDPSRRRRALAFALAAWLVLGSLASYPHSLAYFNELAGGPRGGHRFLLESNLDWGQDLWFLKGWIEDHPEKPLASMAVFTRMDRALFGLDYPLPPSFLSPQRPPHRGSSSRSRGPSPSPSPSPRRYAISANSLHGFPVLDKCGRRLTVLPMNSYKYFEPLSPVDWAGPSIMIFEIEPGDFGRGSGESPPPPGGLPRTRP